MVTFFSKKRSRIFVLERYYLNMNTQLKPWIGINIMMTEDDIKQVYRTAEVWRLNDEYNKWLEAERLDFFEQTRPVVTEKMLTRATQYAKELYY